MFIMVIVVFLMVTLVMFLLIVAIVNMVLLMGGRDGCNSNSYSIYSVSVRLIISIAMVVI